MPSTAVSDKTFGREVLGAAIPVLVEFSAEHSPFNAALDELSSEVAAVKIVKVDVHRHPSLKDEYGVRGLPTYILFKYGKPVSRRLGGLLSKAELKEWIDGALILALATRKTSTAPSATDFILANGMQVIVIPDHRAPIVTHMIWYRAGSADAPKDFSGIARLVQDLTFKSLDKIADGDFSKAVLRMGGQVDGVGHRDATMYWQRVPGEHLQVTMELEVDRMVNLRLTDENLATARGAIFEQRRSAIANNPGVRLLEEMNTALYRLHPYGQPIIGVPAEVGRLTSDDALRFHKLHYAPNNAILVVLGGVTLEQVKQLADGTFGRVAANPDVPQRPRLKPPPQLAPRRVTLADPRTQAAQFYRTYAVPSYATAAGGEAEALDVLARILVRGTGGRLYRRLVIKDKVATSIRGSYFGNMVEAGELTLMALASDCDLSAVEAGVDDVLDHIRSNGVTQEELVGAKRFIVANTIYDDANQLNLSYRYGIAAVLGHTIKDAGNRLAAISGVSAGDVAKVAKKYIIARRSVTGWLSGEREKTKARRTEPFALERRPLGR